MKKLFICGLLLSSSAFAGNFQFPTDQIDPKEKEHLLRMQEQRINILKQENQCSKEASNGDAWFACSDAAKAALKKMRQEDTAFYKERRAERPRYHTEPTR